jgi:predicted metal-dependent hydrolase
MQYPEQYIQFIEKFNEGEYYECHDLLEDIWMEDKADKFLQGLLQLAVGLYHRECGNIKGARWMFGNAKKYLIRYEPARWGLDVAEVLEYIETCENALPDVDAIPYAEAIAMSFPSLRLRLDTS